MQRHLGQLYASIFLTTVWERPFPIPARLRSCASSIKTLFDEFGVEELQWPAQRPDLNPTEHLEKALECKLRARPSRPTSVPDLANALLTEWALNRGQLHFNAHGFGMGCPTS